MSFRFTCREATDRLTDFQEGALPLLQRARVALHLAFCPGCAAFLKGLRRVPRLVAAALTQDPAPAPPEALAALQGALAALGRPRQRIPIPVTAALAAEAPHPLLNRLARAQADLAAGLAPRSAPFLGPGILEGLPAPHAWRWRNLGLGGARLARLTGSQAEGDLLLVQLPPGGRFPGHVHRGAESLLVLQGGLDDGARHGAPGDWFHYEARHPGHAPLAGDDGCWALIWTETGAVRLTGWRGWVQAVLGSHRG